MTFDIVILSYGKTKEHIQTTNDCIASLKKAKNKIGVNIYVLESFNENIKYDGVENFFYQQQKFCYNASMNKGFELTTNNYVFFCNNDLIFYDGWADACYNAFAMGYKSVSPYCPVTHPKFANQGKKLEVGYQVGFHVAGWCIGVERKMFQKLGGFNTAVDFWFSDNLYAEQLKLADVKHALVCNSIVKHLDCGSKTLKTLKKHEMDELTRKQRRKYQKEVRRLVNAKKKTVLH